MKNHEMLDTPGVAIPPPVIVIALFIVGVLANRSLHGSFLAYSNFASIIGAILVLISLALNLWCFKMYARYKTNILPHTPDSTLMTSGPFSFSRNPIYLCMLLLFAGLSLALNAPIALIFLIPTYLALRYYVIAKEEAYLERKFGRSYIDFQNTVRRWI